jgi:hypothetical protein
MENQNEETQEVEETTEEETQEETQGEESEETSEEETIDWEAKARELEGRNKRLQTKLEKKKTTKKTNDSELDYGKLAFFNDESDVKVKSKEDRSFLKEMMEETGKSQDELLETKWFLNDLKEKQESRTVKKAIPSNNKRRGNSEVNEVEYWLAKGELPGNDNVELRRKVLNEKIKRVKNKSKFASQGIVQQ